MATLDSYSETNYDADNMLNSVWNGNSSCRGQTFTTPAYTTTLTSAKFYLKKSGAPTGNIRAEIYAHTGTYGSSGTPTGSILAYSANIASSTLTGDYQLITFTFSGTQQITLSASTYYCLCVTAISETINAENFIYVGGDSTAPSHSGNAYRWYNAAWASTTAYDNCFYVYGIYYTLTITAVDHVTTSPTEGTHNYAINAEVPVTATPATGYLLLHWTLDGLNDGYLNPVTVTMSTDRTLTAVMLKYNSKQIDAIMRGFKLA